MKAAPNENVILDNGMTIRTHDLVFEGGGTVGVNEPDRISVYGTNGGESAIDFGRGNNSPNVKGNVIEDVHTRNVYYDDDSTNDTVRYSEVGPSDFGGNGNLCADLFVTGHTFNPVIEYNLIHDNKGTTPVGPVKRNEPMGLVAPRRPARESLMALAISLMAWPARKRAADESVEISSCSLSVDETWRGGICAILATTASMSATSILAPLPWRAWPRRPPRRAGRWPCRAAFVAQVAVGQRGGGLDAPRRCR